MRLCVSQPSRLLLRTPIARVRPRAPVQVLDGLAQMHAAGLLLGDGKPHNFGLDDQVRCWFPLGHGTAGVSTVGTHYASCASARRAATHVAASVVLGTTA